jgi:dienelactone hydrolase
LRKIFQAQSAFAAHLPLISNAALPLRTRSSPMIRTATRFTAALAGMLLSGSALAADFSTKRVEFLSGDDRVVGTLYVPAGAEAPTAAVVVEGPQTNHRDMVPGTYATKLAAAGFVALTFDHRSFGESGGAVRDFENPAMKVEDIRNAVSFLKSRPEVRADAIGLLGVCSGAGYSAAAAAALPELKALVTIAGFYHDPAVFRSWLGANYDARVALGRAARIKYEATGEVDYMKNVSTAAGEELAMPGQEAYDYYGTARNTGARWANRSATMFFEPFLQFNSIDSGARIEAATMVIHSDTALVPEGAKRFYGSLPGEKKLHWMNTKQHISFYDEQPVVDEAAARATEWFEAKLG